jgi:hypothetical protein
LCGCVHLRVYCAVSRSLNIGTLGREAVATHQDNRVLKNSHIRARRNRESRCQSSPKESVLDKHILLIYTMVELGNVEDRYVSA